jgi:hypothetical protein
MSVPHPFDTAAAINWGPWGGCPIAFQGLSSPGHETPHVCPVCCGAQSVEDSLYDPMGASTTCWRVTCRTCSGSGIVWR